jgi:hypothetical protein
MVIKVFPAEMVLGVLVAIHARPQDFLRRSRGQAVDHKLLACG